MQPCIQDLANYTIMVMEQGAFVTLSKYYIHDSFFLSFLNVVGPLTRSCIKGGRRSVCMFEVMNELRRINLLANDHYN